jgi:phospholipid/cholesterol/gamma-HCH transport system permease protein
MTRNRAWYETRIDGDRLVLTAGGDWTIDQAKGLDEGLRTVAVGRARRVEFRLAEVERLDTAGAWLIDRTRMALAATGAEVELVGLHADHAGLVGRVFEIGTGAKLPPAQPYRLGDVLAQLGEAVVDGLAQARNMLGFFGQIVVTLGRILVRPGRIRFISFVSHLEQTGLNALPIVGLLSFLVGVVLAYQGVDQLRKFGADVFMVNLVGVATLREMGILLTAILIAGRSGSAFTAQIGTMQVNEEVDAMRTLGLDPIEVLVLPRMLALIIAMPLVTFFANLMALIGGGLIGVLLVDLTVPQFVRQLQQAVDIWDFWVGIIKAPVFAFLIAMVGCFEGLRVEGSAESVGRLTTQSVVESIFLVIVFDAFFSILFSYLGV